MYLRCTANSVLAIFRDCVKNDLSLLSEIFEQSAKLSQRELRLRLLALISVMESPFIENSLTTVNLLNYLRRLSGNLERSFSIPLPKIYAERPELSLSADLISRLGLLYTHICQDSEISKIHIWLREKKDRHLFLDTLPISSNMEVIGDNYIKKTCNLLKEAGIFLYREQKNISILLP